MIAFKLLSGGIVFALEDHGKAGAESSPAILVEWDSKGSGKRFVCSYHRKNFFPLSDSFISRHNSIFCGPVSSAIVLNALRLGNMDRLPQDKMSIAKDEMVWLPVDYNPLYGKYTPNNVLNERTKSKIEVFGKLIQIKEVSKRDFGLQLHQLAQVLHSHGLNVTMRVDDETVEALTVRQEFTANLAVGGDYVLVNYARKSLGQEGGGHIWPLGAYDETSDSFLIMDVNPNSAPWVWVNADDWITAMRTFDTIENRGYLLISVEL